MNCPDCKAVLPADTVFCGHYGNPLQVMRPCASCGRTNPVGMRFCLGCGQPVLGIGAPIRAAEVAKELDL